MPEWTYTKPSATFSWNAYISITVCDRGATARLFFICHLNFLGVLVVEAAECLVYFLVFCSFIAFVLSFDISLMIHRCSGMGIVVFCSCFAFCLDYVFSSRFIGCIIF
ncbi:hypothetical protein QBC40DRAFT_78256 [Triangularia verruculosa]|uniref:Uncharacterized protein n=1 Tax=Triangularia verruculosa TaxID=2587418 RepID=A0AAN6XFS4_9PEZI|nr:hypothetical protein QBC40DRAFT_78256 [Triangularia verruculosa]